MRGPQQHGTPPGELVEKPSQPGSVVWLIRILRNSFDLTIDICSTCRTHSVAWLSTSSPGSSCTLRHRSIQETLGIKSFLAKTSKSIICSASIERLILPEYFLISWDEGHMIWRALSSLPGPLLERIATESLSFMVRFLNQHHIPLTMMSPMPEGSLKYSSLSNSAASCWTLVGRDAVVTKYSIACDHASFIWSLHVSFISVRREQMARIVHFMSSGSEILVYTL